MVWLPSLLAGVIAIGITYLELITASYRKTHFLLWRSPQVGLMLLYILVYGGIAFGLMAIVDVLIANKYITLEGLGTNSPWVRAAIVGLTVRALMQITFFNVAVGPGTLPIGIATFTQLYEPMLLESVSQGVWNSGRNFLQPYAIKYPIVADVRTTIASNLPPTLSAERQAALLTGIAVKTSVVEILEMYLNAAGRGTLMRVFPLQP